jgi:hypothetical protein
MYFPRRHLLLCLGGLCLTTALPIQAQPEDSFQTRGRHVNRNDLWVRTHANVLSGFKNMYHAAVLQTGDPGYPYDYRYDRIRYMKRPLP